MPAEYRIEVATAAGVKVAELTEYLSLAYSKKLSEPGVGQFELDGASSKIGLLEDYGQVTVYRRYPLYGLDWYVDFDGFYRGEERATPDRDIFKATIVENMSLLSRRVVAYRTGTANRSSFTATTIETIMKTLVSYNATSLATTGNGRLRNGAIPGLTVAASGGAGGAISWTCPFKPLLGELQDLAQLSGLEFRIVRTGVNAWQFQTYTPTDRTATVIFALERGNMAEPKYIYDRTNERTVAIVAGQGEGTARAVVVRTGPTYSAANDVEVFIDGRNSDTTAALNSDGDKALAESWARKVLTFKPLQTPSSLYGLHYCVGGALGDRITGKYKDITVIQKIAGVTIGVDGEGNEKVDLTMRND